ncbi:heavy metal translocating P-type ATPase [Asticcacaulis excentricus]|uniref:P-type Zn(2+) transporter n=1 Tax=Asticcacaulis excentricus (strain ATCC 15261 / DSM 4724 / KCTC 12464 / NCIMB 9791 / VKM B-1370 / CB 48) TaxID=573065 RepID=E8RW14_ASTEC|nr:heavy metal translocating P-type ATPase [Asticcacaulis excentricus]ADU15436.1 cadmium-translocating P-type ATPase [Asticcacaulis excentricus CB 48]
MASPSPIRLRVEGMDCGACALKIETAVNRLPGASDVAVSYQNETLVLSLDEDLTPAAKLQDQIRSLGYVPSALAEETRTLPAVKSAVPWWKTGKGKLVLMTGLMLAIGLGLERLLPSYALYITSIAALISVFPFARRAVSGALAGSPFSIETLMSVAAIGAVLIGEGEEALTVVFLFAVGEVLETVAAGRARAGIEALIGLVPRTARVERDSGVEEIQADALEIGDIAIVRPGDRIPSDGEVVEGESEVDESPVTGESVPVFKGSGADVFAGSINANGTLRVRITHKAADNTIARIIHLVEEAQESKAPTARFIDRFSLWYTPAAMLVAALIIVIPPVLFAQDWTTWIYRGLATLLIACPCALVISTPTAIASGLAAGARQGLLIKGGAALETLGKIKAVAFDKTGTLTRGKPQVTDIIALTGMVDDFLVRAAAVEANTSHPLGKAIVDAARTRGLDIPAAIGGSTAVPGKAVTARLKSGFVSVGSPSFAASKAALSEETTARINALEKEGKTVVVVLSSKVAEGLIAIRDELREDAKSAVAALNARGIQTLMLTGDNRRTAAAIAAQVGVEAEAELLPEAKLARIAQIATDSPIAMVGDGINDAPALAAASVGIAMGGGTDVALETADAALLKDRVTGVPQLISLSRATLGNIWQNIALALGLKAVFLVTTLTGTTTLWMAILADTGATVLVTLNALRLLGFGRRKGHKDKLCGIMDAAENLLAIKTELKARR